MKNLITILFAALMFAGCTKSEEGGTAPCQDGTIHFINNSVNPYSIAIDNKVATEIGKKSTLDHTVFSGKYYIKATQISGYAVNPVVKEYHVTIKGCDVVDVVIPLSPHDSI